MGRLSEYFALMARNTWPEEDDRLAYTHLTLEPNLKEHWKACRSAVQKALREAKREAGQGDLFTRAGGNGVDFSGRGAVP